MEGVACVNFENAEYQVKVYTKEIADLEAGALPAGWRDLAFWSSPESSSLETEHEGRRVREGREQNFTEVKQCHWKSGMTI